MVVEEQTGRQYEWANMTSEELKARMVDPAVVLIPVGTIEQHGPHLPLDTDSASALYVANTAAKMACEDVNVFVVPPVVFGCSEHHMRFSGTITLSFDTFINVLFDVGASLARHGVRKLIYVNGHGGNLPAARIATCRLTYEAGVSHAIALSYWDLIRDIIDQIRTTPVGGMGHACEFETSFMEHIRPGCIRKNKIPPAQIAVPRLPGDSLDLVVGGSIAMPWLAHEVSPYGVIGDPNKATPEKGCLFAQAAATRLAELIRTVANAPNTLG